MPRRLEIAKRGVLPVGLESATYNASVPIPRGATSMRAAILEATGAPENIRTGELPTPTPKSGEILIKVGAASINPIDMYVRSGMVKMPLPMPFVPGSDVAGTVSAVGPGVRRFKVGDRVWGSNQGLSGRQGTCAEFVCASEEWFYPTPAGVDDKIAAAAAMTSITAHIGVFGGAGLKSGETLFVNGGTGGVGSMVAQMAKAVCARAITTVGSAEKVALAKSWGIDLVLNYKTDDVPARVKEFTGGEGVDVWYETQRDVDLVRTIDLMRKRGRIVLIAGRAAQPILPVGPFYVKRMSMFGISLFEATQDEQRKAAEDIGRWLAEKKLHVAIGKEYPLAETAAAHRFLEDNTMQKAGTLTGKVIIIP
jgi:NADPH2:quinone reductase